VYAHWYTWFTMLTYNLVPKEGLKDLLRGTR